MKHGKEVKRTYLTNIDNLWKQFVSGHVRKTSKFQCWYLLKQWRNHISTINTLGLFGSQNSKKFDGIGMTNSLVMFGSQNELGNLESLEFHNLRNSSFLGLGAGIEFLPTKRVVKFHSNSFKVKFLQWIPIRSNSIMWTKLPLSVLNWYLYFKFQWWFC